MAKSSINFKVVKSSSESHNTRAQKLDYVHTELSHKNDSWSVDSVSNVLAEAKALCQYITGRKMQKNAKPIREAVINLNKHHTVEDVYNVANRLKTRFGIQCFQIHIHRDEGLKEDGKIKINHHAHMLFDFQNKQTGHTHKLNPLQLSQIQTLVAEELEMERGELKVNSNTERLEAVEYKRLQEEIRLKKAYELHMQYQEKSQEEKLELQFNQQEIKVITQKVQSKEEIIEYLNEQIRGLDSNLTLKKKQLSETTESLIQDQITIKQLEGVLNALSQKRVLQPDELRRLADKIERHNKSRMGM